MREEALALRNSGQHQPTAVLTHGANPGLVSHFVKQALVNIAADLKLDTGSLATREDWAALAQKLDVRVIHVAERDTQVSSIPKEPNEFVNTWSVDGFVSEGSQPAELGWGSHERNFPRDGKRFEFRRRRRDLPDAARRGHARAQLGAAGRPVPRLPDHARRGDLDRRLPHRAHDPAEIYRPSVHYAYHPSDNAVLSVHEFAGRNYLMQDRKRIMMDDITTGIDELGVLLAGHKKNAYWYGSQLSIEAARKLAPHNSATTLQVTVAVLAGMVWAMENPNRGVVEPDEMDYRRCLEICLPYLGPVVGQYTDWTPLSDRERLFPEDLDKSDPWQFKNVRVS